MKQFYVFLSVISFLLCSIPGVKAELTIDVSRGQMQSMPIAIPDFAPSSIEYTSISQEMAQAIRDNLKSSGLFNILDSKTYLQSSADVAAQGPRFTDWKTIGAQALISGKITQASATSLRVEFRLWDVFGRSQMIGMAYTTTQDNWRRIAHIISDEVFKRITGQGGYFDSRIVYVAESGPANKRVKRLAIMDQDGRNHKYLTDGSFMVLTPRFSPTTQQITYLAYIDRRPRVYLYDINTGRQEVLGDFPGMTFAPRFTPDGQGVVMSLATNGNTDIYQMNLNNRQVSRLTTHPSIDTSPSYAPDGSQIVFESDRGGSQQLYVMNADGSNPKRITFGEGRYANPVWSPAGDVIAFTRMYKGQFYIGVIRPDGGGERLISTAYHVEGPSWSPNGRYLVYFKEETYGANREKRRTKLYQIDVTGFHERELNTPGNASDPAWSPLNE